MFGHACGPYRAISLEEEVLREERVKELLAQAIGALREGEQGLPAAQASLHIANELQPNDARVIDGFGCVAWRVGDVALAKQYFHYARELDPNYDRPVAHLAEVARVEGDMPLADTLYEEAIALNPLNARARNNFAVYRVVDRGGREQRELAAYELEKASVIVDDPIILENQQLLRQER